MLITIMLANVHESEAFSLFGKTVHVKITNRLSQKKRLLVHCKSKNDDLGEHWLRTGESYEFKFGESFMWTSLFFCGYTFDGQKHLEDAYDATQNDCREHCCFNSIAIMFYLKENLRIRPSPLAAVIGPNHPTSPPPPPPPSPVPTSAMCYAVVFLS
ncbi:hypothetical protein Cgig2_005116 [Carnegiea gigantea]|uniref:S-protein homolog n=1 Tax=Carnegiea gigantea TaxID=171969 RepID=A0A9Q1KG20_9CARY|nr:hypothetical protein Cgig2_005415 [Carnegiea gigantea]KAJ8442176.1 hypothetical protein Cgig2_005116 [Carnegiea gigantea]